MRNGCWVFIFSIWLFLPNLVWSQSTPDVVIIHSFDQYRAEVKQLEDGFREALVNEQRYPVTFRVESRYLKANNWKVGSTPMKLAVQSMASGIIELQPRLVILVDPVAIQKLGPYLAEYSDLRILTLGGICDNLGYPNENARFFSLFNSVPLIQNAQLWGNLPAVPQPGKGLLITDSYHKAYFDDFLQQLEQDSLKLPVQWELKEVSSWKQLQAAVRWANYRKDIQLIYPVASLLAWENQAYLHRSQMLDWISQASNKPIIGLTVHSVEHGFSMGIAQNRRFMGEMAARWAAEMLRENEVSQDQLDQTSAYTMSFNLKALQKLGITVPADLLTAAEYVFQ